MANPEQSSRSSDSADQHFNVFAWLAKIVLWIALAVNFVTLFAGQWWFADLLTHFRVQMVLAMMPVLIVFLVYRFRFHAIVSLLLFIFLAWPMLGYLMPGWISTAARTTTGTTIAATDDPSPSYRLMTFNVLTSNRDYQATVNFIREIKPDFVVLVEVDREWTQAMKELAAEYPHSRFHERADNFGVAILARDPWQTCKIKDQGDDQLPVITSTFELGSESGGGGQRLQIQGVHPIPPMGREMADSRNSYLIQAIEELDPGVPRIVTGDFNLSPWSPWFAKVNRLGGTRDAALGHGIGALSATWHVFPTVVGGIKIDHALVSPEIHVLDYQIGQDLGSDHRPIVIEFRIGSSK